MATRKMNAKDIMNELDTLFLALDESHSQTREEFQEFLQEPLAYHDDFELARIADAFEQLGGLLKGIVRNSAINRFSDKNREEESNGVTLRWRQGNPDATRIDTTKLKALFPEKDYPDFYKSSPTRETVVITIKKRP